MHLRELYICVYVYLILRRHVDYDGHVNPHESGTMLCAARIMTSLLCLYTLATK